MFKEEQKGGSIIANTDNRANDYLLNNISEEVSANEEHNFMNLPKFNSNELGIEEVDREQSRSQEDSYKYPELGNV